VRQPFTVGCAGLCPYFDSTSVGLSSLDAYVDVAVAVVVGGGEVESDDAAERDRGGDDCDEEGSGGQSANTARHRSSKR
jgi:hypothetical protein